VVLLCLRCPPAVLRRVRPIVVRPAINAVLRAWLAPHVSEKVSVAILPSLANRDAPTAVVGEVISLRVEASSAKGAPCSVFWGPIALAVFRFRLAVARRKILFVKTATGFRVPAFQALAADHFLSAAVAPAKPMSPSLSSFSEGKDKQAAESLASDINRIGHERLHQSCFRQVTAGRGKRLAVAPYYERGSIS
jgi:hypothetical protein